MLMQFVSIRFAQDAARSWIIFSLRMPREDNATVRLSPIFINPHTLPQLRSVNPDQKRGGANIHANQLRSVLWQSAHGLHANEIYNAKKYHQELCETCSAHCAHVSSTSPGTGYTKRQTMSRVTERLPSSHYEAAIGSDEATQSPSRSCLTAAQFPSVCMVSGLKKTCWCVRLQYQVNTVSTSPVN